MLPQRSSRNSEGARWRWSERFERTSGSEGLVTVDISTVEGTATGDEDYESNSATLVWESGDSSAKTFTITMIQDTMAEGSESFQLVLSEPLFGATLGSPSTMSVTIQDDGGETLALASLAGPAGAPPVSGGVILALDPAWPNPANPSVTVRFRASPREMVRLRILDVRGRLVTDLYHGPGTGDWQHEVWNGRNRDGVAAASGLYLIHLQDGRQTLSRRVVLAR